MNIRKITISKIKNRIKYNTCSIINTVKYKTRSFHIENYKKVLHIWDTAGVASLLARELNKNGYDAHVIMRSLHDPFGMTKYYGQESLDLEGTPYLIHCKKEAEKYGIIHIHGIYEIVPEYKKLFPNKKIVLQFHGTELTQPRNEKELVECSKYADAIICSTPDLEEHVLKHPELKKPYICLNAIDTQLFKPIPGVEKITNKALYIKIRYIDFESVKKYLEKHCKWEYEIFDRDLGESIHCEKTGRPFYEMPKFYNQYKKFIDVKIYAHLNGIPAQAWSKSGLEALACGLEVFNYQNKIFTELPEQFTPEYQCKSVIHVYKQLTQS